MKHFSKYDTQKRREKLYTETKEILKNKKLLSQESLYHIQMYIQKTYNTTI